MSEKGKPSERVGRKATGLSTEPLGIRSQGCRANTMPPHRLCTAHGLEEGTHDLLLESIQADFFHSFTACRSDSLPRRSHSRSAYFDLDGHLHQRRRLQDRAQDRHLWYL